MDMNSDRTTDTRASAADKFATTKQAGSSSAPITLQLRNGSFPVTFGRYELLRLLGEGSMGGVYLGKDTQLERDVAIKIPKFDNSDRGAIERFQREARAMATLRHANLCPVYDVGELDGVQYFTMAYIEGKTLSEHLIPGKALPGREVALLTLKLAQALEEAHKRGVVHRDLKPANIIIDHNKEPVVMDFGLARLAEATSNLTQSGLMIGTPAYMAPEQVRGELERICPASDVYSLGAIMYEMLTGRLAFEGSVTTIVKQTLAAEPALPSQIVSGVAEGLDEICLKAMAKEPNDRYVSGGAMAAAVREYLQQTRETSAKTIAPVRETVGTAQPASALPGFGGTAEPSPAVNNLASLRRHRRRHMQRKTSPWWLLAGAGGAVLLLGLLFIALKSRDSEVAQGTLSTRVRERLDTETSPVSTASPQVEPAEATDGPSRTAELGEGPAPERHTPSPADGPGGPPGALPPDGRFRYPPRTAAEIIQDFDRNGDGMLQVPEIPFEQRPHIMRADADRDGVVVAEELDVFLILFQPHSGN